jgi:rhodanese-related sulfurtransferase
VDHRLSGIDHFLVGVRDLESARVTWNRLGFTTTPRGRHVGWGTANYCIMFAADYIELLGILDPSQFTSGLDQFLAEREGMLGVALGTTDATVTAEAWRMHDLASQGPNALSRLLELPGGSVEPRFRNVLLPLEATGGLRLFACQHLTPALLRQPGWIRHANGALALMSCTIVAPDPAALSEAMGRIFGTTALTRTDTLTAIQTGSAVMLVASARQAAHLHPAFDIEVPDKRPLIQVMAIMVESTDAAAAHLASHGVPHRRDPRGSVLVPAEQANGVNLELVQG